jgi:hypothetical protein
MARANRTKRAGERGWGCGWEGDGVRLEMRRGLEMEEGVDCDW